MAENKLGGVGLVLSGGGGKGAYQIGVLKVLKENGLLEDVSAISGVSIGAVNAMLYAMDDINLMYDAWKDIDMETVFDVDLEMIRNGRIYFSRSEMLAMISKYLDFEKLKNSPYDIYAAMCRIGDANGTNAETVEIYNSINNVAPNPEYARLKDYDEDTIKKILLASTALPIVYEAVEFNGGYYRDGGICDNEPIKPLYDAGIREFIVIGLKHGKIFDASKWSDAHFVTIYPSYDLGNLVEGTLDFSSKSIDYRQLLGEKDGLRSIKTKFNMDENYIKMESALAKIDHDEIMMRLKTQSTMKSVEARVNSNIEKFNEIAKKFENF